MAHKERIEKAVRDRLREDRQGLYEELDRNGNLLIGITEGEDCLLYEVKPSLIERIEEEVAAK